MDMVNNSGKSRDISSNDGNDYSGKAQVAEEVRGVNKCEEGLGSEACHMLLNLLL